MTNRTYQKLCDAEDLTVAIVGAGLPQHPDPGARFYGVTVVADDQPQTIVHCYDDLTPAEEATIDGVVGAQ